MKPDDFRAVAHHFPGPCLLVDGKGEVLAANSAADRLAGLNRSKLEGACLFDLVSDDREVVFGYLRAASRTRGPLVGTLTLLADREIPCVCSAGVTVPASANRPAQLLLHLQVRASATDRFRLLNDQIAKLSREVRRRLLAEREKERLLRSERQVRADLEQRTRDLEAAYARLEAARQEAEAARAEAEIANRGKSDFLAAMSHELRTPLNAIGGYVELLEIGVHGDVPASQREVLRRIAVNQRHLLTVINDILSYARIEAGQVEFDTRPFTAMEVLSRIEPLVAPLAAARGIAYSLRECSPSIRLIGDEERVLQILLNLVGNAVKFTPPGGGVVVACEADSQCVDIHVRDNGPGIPPEKQERIFDPFAQAERSLSQPQEGVGLGLAISRDLARGMGGELGVESVPGEGSTFTFRLPIDPDCEVSPASA